MTDESQDVAENIGDKYETKLRVVKRRITREMDDHDKAEIAQARRALEKRNAELDRTKKVVNDTIKGKKAAVTEADEKLAETWDSGEVEDLVDCDVIVSARQGGMLIIRRCDTGEVIFDRPLDKNEREAFDGTKKQADLFATNPSGYDANLAEKLKLTEYLSDQKPSSPLDTVDSVLSASDLPNNLKKAIADLKEDEPEPEPKKAKKGKKEKAPKEDKPKGKGGRKKKDAPPPAEDLEPGPDRIEPDNERPSPPPFRSEEDESDGDPDLSDDGSEDEEADDGDGTDPEGDGDDVPGTESEGDEEEVTEGSESTEETTPEEPTDPESEGTTEDAPAEQSEANDASAAATEAAPLEEPTEPENPYPNAVDASDLDAPEEPWEDEGAPEPEPPTVADATVSNDATPPVEDWEATEEDVQRARASQPVPVESTSETTNDEDTSDLEAPDPEPEEEAEEPAPASSPVPVPVKTEPAAATPVLTPAPATIDLPEVDPVGSNWWGAGKKVGPALIANMLSMFENHVKVVESSELLQVMAADMGGATLSKTITKAAPNVPDHLVSQKKLVRRDVNGPIRRVYYYHPKNEREALNRIAADAAADAKAAKKAR